MPSSGMHGLPQPREIKGQTCPGGQQNGKASRKTGLFLGETEGPFLGADLLFGEHRAQKLSRMAEGHREAAPQASQKTLL
jgi:hypothetical protein